MLRQYRHSKSQEMLRMKAKNNEWRKHVKKKLFFLL